MDPYIHVETKTTRLPFLSYVHLQICEVYQISCANFYVKLLGLTGQDFVTWPGHQKIVIIGWKFIPLL